VCVAAAVSHDMYNSGVFGGRQGGSRPHLSAWGPEGQNALNLKIRAKLAATLAAK